MRVAIATVQVPFVRGGAEFLAESLRREICAAGHQAEIVSVPFHWAPASRIPDQMLACRLLDLQESNNIPIDRVIGLKFPAYLVPHPSKVMWLLHQYRGAYDLWGTADSDLSNAPDGAHIRHAIVNADMHLIPEARAIYTISNTVSDRLRRYCSIGSTPLYHPPPFADRFRAGDYGDFLLCPSRINPLKRQELLLRALAETRQPVRVVFMGAPDSPAYGNTLQAGAAMDDWLRDRVVWTGRVSDEEKYRLFAECRGVVFVPKDEDYGYVTLEAMLAAKPVITCRDSGGVLEFVRHGVTGLVAAPHPQSLAVAMDRLWEQPALAEKLGTAGRAHYQSMQISWPAVLEHLLQ